MELRQSSRSPDTQEPKYARDGAEGGIGGSKDGVVVSSFRHQCQNAGVVGDEIAERLEPMTVVRVNVFVFVGTASVS